MGDPIKVLQTAIATAVGEITGHGLGDVEGRVGNKLPTELAKLGFVIVPLEPSREVVFAGANAVYNFNRYEKPGMKAYDDDLERFKDRTAVRVACLYRAMVVKSINAKGS